MGTGPDDGEPEAGMLVPSAGTRDVEPPTSDEANAGVTIDPPDGAGHRTETGPDVTVSPPGTGPASAPAGSAQQAADVAARPPFTVNTQVERPLTLLAWDAPNMDVTLHEILAGSAVVRPDMNAVTRWLCSIAIPSGDVEASLFCSIGKGRGSAMLPWIQAVRSAGMAIFARPRSSGDIDDAFAAYVESRLALRTSPGVLVLGSHDQALAGRLGDLAHERGWRVLQLCYREGSAWATGRAGWEIVDVEDVPGAFATPLVRLALDHFPAEGRWIPPGATLQPNPAGSAEDRLLAAELNQLIRQMASNQPEGVLAAAIGHQARRSIPEFAERAADWPKFAALVQDAVREGGLRHGVRNGHPAVFLATQTAGNDEGTET